MQDKVIFRFWDTKHCVMLDWDCICQTAFNRTREEGNEIQRYGLMYFVFTTLQRFIPLQCTGLRDKNGKLIYEGDIVYYPDEYCRRNKYEIYLEIVWKEGEYRAQGSFTTKSSNLQFRDYRLVYFTREDGLMDVEVIGNIYQNPELLEEKC